MHGDGNGEGLGGKEMKPDSRRREENGDELQIRKREKTITQSRYNIISWYNSQYTINNILVVATIGDFSEFKFNKWC